MADVVLCGHTGSSNHGCEAIVRSTISLINCENLSSIMGSYALDEDMEYGLNDIIKIIPYRNYKSKVDLKRLYNGIMKKFFNNEYPYEKYIQKKVFDEIKRAKCAMVIGGDTYCYGRNSCIPSYCMNRYANKHNVKSVLWSCSINKDAFDLEMINNLNKYSLLFPRESETYNNLISVGIDKNKIFQMCDSAFILNSEKIKLPENFNNIFAYNPSYTLGIEENMEMIMENRIELLKYIIEETDMKIALIPHVYKKNFGDAKICERIYEALDKNNRIFLFNQEYNCEQLKYIISKCRFLVAERTHASIAGYSSFVPTFVVGYSVKSIGIAKDLFGSDKNYVISHKEITNKNVLKKEIISFINNEEQNKRKLEKVIPQYCESAYLAIKKLKTIL